MIIKKNLLVLLFNLILFTALAQSVSVNKSETIENRNGRNYYIHHVDKGQTVYSIARAYNVSVDEIYFENPAAKNGISIGQELLIPTINKETQLSTEVKETNYEFFYHIAASHETFKHIANIYVIPEDYIRKANPTLHDPLREGEYVKVPVEASFAALDGKAATNDYVSSSSVQTRPRENQQPKKSEPDPAYNAPDRQQPTEVKPQSVQNQNKPIANTKNADSEFVTFDPNIPVISDYRHVVIMGETTQSVADKYDIPVQLLKAANPGLGNSVVKGDRLRVPDKTRLKKPDTIEESVIGKTQANVQQEEAKKPVVLETSTPQEPDYIKHLVKKKETLYSIGREYGVTVAEIQAVNKGLSTNIFIGQTINIPKKKISNDFIELRIKAKTKLKSIAALYQIDFTRLKNANPGLRRRVLEGQIVKIPVGETARNFDDQPLEPEIIPDENEEVNIPFAPNTAFQCLKNQPRFNQVFKVALMLPLYLEEMDSLNKAGFLQQQQTSFKPFRFIGFYEGAMIALDSLQKKGMLVELYIYDVDQNLAKAAKVLQQPELRSMNLIIGPLFPDCFHQVALFAGNFNIPIVNPLTFREETVQSYKTVIKVKPGIGFQNESLVNYFQRIYPMDKVFFITQNPYEDAVQVQNMVNALRMAIPAVSKISNSDLYNMAVGVAHRQEDFTTGDPLPYFKFEGQDIFPDLLENKLSDSTTFQNNLTRIVYSSDNLTPFIKNASPLRENLVILYGNKKSFVLDVMNQLNEIRDTFNIKLIGVPTWERLSDLNNTQLSNLNLTYFSSDYMNYESPETQQFIWEFRQRFSTEPDTYAYLGFDVTYYFLDNLFLFGDQFTSCLETNPKKMLQTTYQFKRQYQNSFENSYWNLLQYKWLNLYKIPDALIAPSNKYKE